MTHITVHPPECRCNKEATDAPRRDGSVYVLSDDGLPVDPPGVPTYRPPEWEVARRREWLAGLSAQEEQDYAQRVAEHSEDLRTEATFDQLHDTYGPWIYDPDFRLYPDE